MLPECRKQARPFPPAFSDTVSSRRRYPTRVHPRPLRLHQCIRAFRVLQRSSTLEESAHRGPPTTEQSSLTPDHRRVQDTLRSFGAVRCQFQIEKRPGKTCISIAAAHQASCGLFDSSDCRSPLPWAEQTQSVFAGLGHPLTADVVTTPYRLAFRCNHGGDQSSVNLLVAVRSLPTGLIRGVSWLSSCEPPADVDTRNPA